MFDEPREDEQLCAAALSRDRCAIEDAIRLLQPNHSSLSFSRAMITAIGAGNLAALGRLLEQRQPRTPYPTAIFSVVSDCTSPSRWRSKMLRLITRTKYRDNSTRVIN